jgi:tRNA uridine 5-carboxymethylaminomethyl modification enzyme
MLEQVHVARKQHSGGSLRQANEGTRPAVGSGSDVNSINADNAISSPVNLFGAVGQTLAQLLRRPEISIEHFVPVLHRLYSDFFGCGEISEDPRESVPLSSGVRNELKSVETELKYAGYLDQQRKAMERLRKAEQRIIPEWFDYSNVSGLSREMKEKLERVRPQTIGQASRIPGVTPAALSLINVYVEIQGRRHTEQPADHI